MGSESPRESRPFSFCYNQRERERERDRRSEKKDGSISKQRFFGRVSKLITREERE